MNDRAVQPIELAMAVGGVPSNELTLHGVRGRERISRLFAYELFFSREAGPFSRSEIEGLFQAPCAIAMGPGPGDVIRGVFQRITRLTNGLAGATLYHAHLVPTTWLLTLARTNRIFQQLNVQEIFASVMAQYGLLPGNDYQLLVQAKSPKREYTVQYEESDWDFLQRWFEHEGIYYWFEHSGKKDVLVVSDVAANATDIAAPTVVRARSKNNLETGDDSTVSEWSCTDQRIPARVALFDYNYRNPQVRLLAQATADAKSGFGTEMRYGEHFKTVEEGVQIARLRAERLACQRTVYSGRTDCSRFRAGYTFTLSDTDEHEENRKYLITEIDLQVGEFFDTQDRAPKRYAAHFSAIPLDLQYRPDCSTPWPSIHGMMNGHIAADGSGTYAEIDEYGRYKVSLPFDSGNAKGLSVSRWIRMAQPYSGAGYGSHHPLHKGTEVLIAYIDGDPDRPLIVASIPNMVTISPSVKGNATQSVTRTASGIQLEMEDLATGGTTARGGRR